MDKIILKGIQFYGYHGVSDVEREVGQKYAVDIEIPYDLKPAGTSDELENTVNYAKVYKLVTEVGTNENFKLIEALAEKIADAILTSLPVENVTVKVMKLTPPIAGNLDYAGVEITRSK